MRLSELIRNTLGKINTKNHLLFQLSLFRFVQHLHLLVQPIAKISLGRQIWNIMDVVVAIGLIGSIFVRKKVDQ